MSLFFYNIFCRYNKAKKILEKIEYSLEKKNVKKLSNFYAVFFPF